VPVSLRSAQGDGGLDNHVSAVLCDLPVHVADPVERLAAVKVEMGRLKAAHMVEAGAWFIELGELAPPMLVGGITRLVARAMHTMPQRSLATITTNVPGPREPLYFLGRRMLDWFPYVPITQGARIATAILSYAGRIGFGVTADPDGMREVAIFARAIEAAMAELVAAAARHAQGIVLTVAR
jgi:diacylglycerol O-acyltransferase